MRIHREPSRGKKVISKLHLPLLDRLLPDLMDRETMMEVEREVGVLKALRAILGTAPRRLRLLL